MDAAIAGLIGAAIGAIAGIIGSIANGYFQLRQLREQREHEEKKAQSESEATKDRQMKERLQEIYANAVSSLSEIAINVQRVHQGVSAYLPHTDKLGEAQK